VIWASRAIGLAVLGWIIYLADWARFSATIAPIAWRGLLVLPLMTVVMLALRARRWQLLVNNGEVLLSLGRAWSIYAAGIFLGSFTPGRLGDLAKAAYLHQEYRMSWKSAAASTLLDRLLDLLVLFLCGLWAVWRLGDPRMFILLLGVMLTFGLIFAFLMKSGRIYPKPESTSVIARGMRFFVSLREEMRNSWNRAGRPGLGLTLAAYGVYFTQVILLARALGLNLAVADIVAMVTLIGLAAFLPISVAGLGTREGILALVLAKFAVPNSLEVALLFSAGFLIFCFIVPALLGGICWLWTPLSSRSLEGIEGNVRG
jgi:hypothetical protein